MDDASPERIPLRAIAEKANVSRMTVSRALRGDPAISAPTQRKILQLARRLGYRPDPNLTRLMETIRMRRRNRVANVIAYLTCYEQRAGWRQHPTQRICFEGAAQRAAECGYRLEEFWAREPGMTDHRIGDIIHARGIEGVLVAPLSAPQLVLQRFPWDRFSAVQIGYSLAQPALHRVCSHQFQSVMLLAEKLHAAGHRRVGLAMSRQHDERVHHHWRAGHLAANSLWGEADGRALMFLPADWSRTAFARWLKHSKPDAIITIGPQVADWLEELRLDIPEDISLANVDVALAAPGTTGIDQSPHLIGAAAIDLLISLIHHHECGVPAVPRVTKVQGIYVPGRTVGVSR